MSNHSYIISQGYFYQKRKEKSTIDMIRNTELEFCNDALYPLLTANSIESALNNFGYNYKSNKIGKRRYEFVIGVSPNPSFQIEFDCQTKDSELDLIEIDGNSDHEMLINFFRLLINDYGRFLYYSTSGYKSIISEKNNNDQIFKEMHFLNR